MKRFNLIFSFIILLAACDQANTHADVKKITDSGAVSLAQHVSKLDSLDKANQALFLSGNDRNKAFVLLKDGDSSINIISDKFKDHRFFGYAMPDLSSERILLFSVFTNDVKNNPFGCRLGAYYNDVSTPFKLKYVSASGNFIKAIAVDSDDHSTNVFFEKSWIEFM
jgi:hypothetical protein